MAASGQKRGGGPLLSEVFAKFRRDGLQEMKHLSKPELAGANINAQGVEKLGLYTYLQKRKARGGDVTRYRTT